MPKKVFYSLLLVGIIVVASVFFIRKGNKNQNNSTTDFVDYQSVKGEYKVKVPNNWELSESTESAKFKSRTVWQATQNGTYMGNISQISITEVATSGAGQPLSTQSEFEDWYSKENNFTSSDSGTIKVDNVQIDNQNAVRLKEEEIIKVDIPNSFFSYTSWFRVNGINYYMNILGNGLYADYEANSYKKVLDSFKLK